MDSTDYQPTHEHDDDDVQYCKKCSKVLEEGRAYELGGNRWHVECFQCSRCHSQLDSDTQLLVLGDGTLVCYNCSYRCHNCNKKIDDLAILTGNQAYCRNCFCCRNCKKKIGELQYARTSQGIFCMNCHQTLLARKRRTKQKQQQQQQQQQQRTSSELNPMLSNSSLNKTVRPSLNHTNSSGSSSGLAMYSSPSGASINSYKDKSLPSIPPEFPIKTTPPPIQSSTNNTPPPSSPLPPPPPVHNSMTLSPNLSAFNRYSLQPPPRSTSKRASSISFTQGVNNNNMNSSSRTTTVTETVTALSEENRKENRSSEQATDAFLMLEANDSNDFKDSNRHSAAFSIKLDASVSPFIEQSEESAMLPIDVSKAITETTPEEDNSMRTITSAERQSFNTANEPVEEEHIVIKLDPIISPSFPTGDSSKHTSGESLQSSGLDNESFHSLFSNTSSTPESVMTKSNNNVRRSLDHSSSTSVREKTTITISDTNSTSSRRGSNTSLTVDEQKRLMKSSSTTSSLRSFAATRKEDAIIPSPLNLSTSVLLTNRGEGDSNDVDGEDRELDSLIPLRSMLRPISPAPPLSPIATNTTATTTNINNTDSVESTKPPITPRSPESWSSKSSLSAVDIYSRISSPTSYKSPEKHSGSVSSSSPMISLPALKSATDLSGVLTPYLTSRDDEFSQLVRRDSDNSNQIISSRKESPKRREISANTNSNLTKELTDAKKRISELENQLLIEKEAGNDLKNKRKTIAGLEAQGVVVRKELEVLNDAAERKRESTGLVVQDFIIEMEGVKADLAEEISQLIEQRDNLKRQVDDLTTERDKAAHESTLLNLKNTQLADMNNELQRQLIDKYGPVKDIQKTHKKELSNSSGFGDNYEPMVTVLDQGEVIDTRKDRQHARRFWKRPGAAVAKGLNRVFATEESSLNNNNNNNNNYMVSVTDLTQPTEPVTSAGGGGLGISFPNKESGTAGLGGIKHSKSSRNNWFKSSDHSNEKLLQQTPLLINAGSNNNSISGPYTESTIEERIALEGTMIPAIVTKCIEEVEKRGMRYEGIYRKSGGKSQIQSIEEVFDKLIESRYEEVLKGDICGVTSAVKQYLRYLAIPLITFAAYDDFIKSINENRDVDAQVDRLRGVVNSLPKSHRDCLEYVIRHLSRVTMFSNENLMTSKNLSVVFAPTLARHHDGEREILDMQPRNDATQLLIDHCESIFNGI